MNPSLRFLLILLFPTLLLLPVRAEVVRIEIRDRTSFAEGKSWGSSGPYERIRGRLYLETDPANPANERIADLKNAAVNEGGKVESWTDFFLLKPVDAMKGNGQLLYDVNNRGNKLALWTFNDGLRTNDPQSVEHAGNGFLMKHGFSVLWCGWNGEVQADDTHRLLCQLPIATDHGKTITGRAFFEFCTSIPMQSRAFSWSPWGIGAAYATERLDNANATLTVRPDRRSEGTEIPRSEWAFGEWKDGKLIPDPTTLYLKDGMKPGFLYDLVYTAKDPRVTGLGLAALRDCIAYFRSDSKENPLAGSVKKAHIFGISQSGRVIQHLLYEGMNRDEAGNLVFDGALIHVPGAGKGMFNYRFRMSTEFGTQHEGHLSGSEFFPMAPVSTIDPVTGESGNLLARSRASNSVPRILITQTSTEYWNRAAALLHTDVEGKSDLILPDDVRIYLVAGAEHLGQSDGTPGDCQQPRNTLDDRGPVLRAMLMNLVHWVEDDTPPPPSRYPRIDDGTLVEFNAWKNQFPKIAGHNLPLYPYIPSRLDFGPRFLTQGIADTVPPEEGEPFHVLVPAVTVDGIDQAGIVLPQIAAPLGTYTGWNLRSPKVGAETMLSALDGMFIPFAKTRSEREAKGDPRLSLEERYPSRADYITRLTESAHQLQKENFLLEEDTQKIIDVAQEAAW